MNEFNLKYGFENYTVTKIFDASSNDKKVWKKKKVYTIQYAILIILLHYSKINNIYIYKYLQKPSHHWNLIWMQIPTKNLNDNKSASPNFVRFNQESSSVNSLVINTNYAIKRKSDES